MGDSCTGTPTFTSFSASTEQTFSVSQSTSESLSIADPSVVTRILTLSGTDVVTTESTIPGATVTVPAVVPVTVTGQQVVQVPVLTLFAPCSTSETSSTSTTPITSSTPITTSSASSSSDTTDISSSRTPTSETRTSEPNSATASGSSSSRQNSASTPAVTPSPTRSTPSSNSNTTETGTIIVTTSLALTTLPNGSQSTYIATLTTSVAPNGSLNNNDNTGSGGSSSNRAVAIGVGVAGGVVALIILMLGITWHIRRKRRNVLGVKHGVDESEVWGPHHEAKTPQGSANSNTRARYSYNPYSDVRTTSYAPVPTMSPPRARPMSLGDGHTPRASVSSAGVGVVGGGSGLVVAPLLGRTKTADEILYEAAREDLPRSRTTSATASHRAHGSLTASSHRAHGSLTASSHMTHGQRSDSIVGLLEHPVPAPAGSSPAYDADFAHHYHAMVDAADEERPTSPVSVVAPRLAIVNPDTDKDP